MIKPDSLRAFLADAVPEFRRNPKQLQIFFDDGQLAATAVPNISFEYRYTLNILITDYAGHPDAIMVPLLVWIAEHQPELLQNPDRRGDIKFEADILDNDKVDLSINIPLTERVGVIPRAEGGFNVEHYPEPQEEPPWPATHWQLYLKDELIAEWDIGEGQSGG